jgi:predicted nucleic-acid-binding Zn-ribbon protein
MHPMKCPACASSSFHHDQWIAALGAFPRTFVNIFRSLFARCSICLACGYVSTYIDDATLAKLRARSTAWKSQEATG